MALNKRRITQRPIGPAMQWTRRASQKPDAQKTAGNINIDLEAYQTAERKQPEPKRHKPSKQTGNPVAYKKQKGTKEQPHSNYSTENTTSLPESRNTVSDGSYETAWNYYSRGAQGDHYTQWSQSGMQHQPNTQFNDSAVGNFQRQSSPQHRTANKTNRSRSSSQHFTDTGAIRPHSSARSSNLSIKQYVLPFVVVVTLVVLGILASLG